MAYIPPAYTAVDFELSTYTVSAVDALDFTLIGDVVVATNPKVKISGAFSSKPIKLKVSGSFVEETMKVKVSGTFK